MSKDGGQKAIEDQAEITEDGQTETVEADIQKLEHKKDMKMTKLTKRQLVTSKKAAEIDSPTNNVLNFMATVKEPVKNFDPDLVKKRDGWSFEEGNANCVDYVEWHTVADILDKHAPNWSHAIRDIRQIGEIFTVTVAITIDGVTREGVGTGFADSEKGIKKAEHDALKSAAVKFGIARALLKKELDVIEGEAPISEETYGGGFPANPIARSLSDLVTARQLEIIRAISREIGRNADSECQTVMQCETNELSKQAASAFIRHLRNLQNRQEILDVAPMRRAG